MSAALQIVHTHDQDIVVRAGTVKLLRYVYRPTHPQLESPRPYFHPLRTLDGDLVSCYRPWDHVWHKGISLALPNVGAGNFWGGPTYVRDKGYQQLANNGSQDHQRFGRIDSPGDAVEVTHELEWRSEQGELWLTEERSWSVRLLPDESAWILGFSTELRNVRGEALAFGSPTTNGRPAAGYGGFFWRGPRSFTGGKVLTPEHEGGDETMGERAPWLAYVGLHDESARGSTLVFVDDPENPRSPTPWFVRSAPFAAVCPAPFFSEELDVAPGESLRLRYRVVVASASWDRDRVAAVVKAQH